MSSTTSSRADVYARVTDRIIADLEAGLRPWLKPWKTGSSEGRIAVPRRYNGTPYRGINILLLWGAAMAKGYRSPLWMTYRQAGELSKRGQARDLYCRRASAARRRFPAQFAAESGRGRDVAEQLAA